MIPLNLKYYQKNGVLTNIREKLPKNLCTWRGYRHRHLPCSTAVPLGGSPAVIYCGAVCRWIQTRSFFGAMDKNTGKKVKIVVV
jgi:hypothetical protein